MTDARGGNAAPRLGVGICALNEARALPRLLSRLLQVRDATDRADAVAVADGGSSDGTAELARRMGARVVEPGR
ncbi:MAG: glycosyltransferase, partial [Planctomycetota bacterium]